MSRERQWASSSFEPARAARRSRTSRRPHLVGHLREHFPPTEWSLERVMRDQSEKPAAREPGWSATGTAVFVIADAGLATSSSADLLALIAGEHPRALRDQLRKDARSAVELQPAAASCDRARRSAASSADGLTDRELDDASGPMPVYVEPASTEARMTCLRFFMTAKRTQTTGVAPQCVGQAMLGGCGPRAALGDLHRRRGTFRRVATARGQQCYAKHAAKPKRTCRHASTRSSLCAVFDRSVADYVPGSCWPLRQTFAAHADAAEQPHLQQLPAAARRSRRVG